ncbi:hypothetical protein EV702DRAFT_1277532 [Suillus placidus]|uniref:DUF6533 domain-containing protein n=1 Tax=Suillus placidus TaxID=48579 RepID=A0A9P6ZZR9_9AGAM|nr:hypothetical protein EV702DRAFT_1277532 [Suillus placidus]
MYVFFWLRPSVLQTAVKRWTHNNFATLTHRPSNMMLISNDPSWWPLILSFRNSSYFVVASSTAMVYDWALMFGQEIELVWRPRWSLMTLIYLGVRYAGMPYIVLSTLRVLPQVSTTDQVRDIIYAALNGLVMVVNAILGVVMITRLHAMYLGSSRMLMILVVIFVPVQVTCGVMVAIAAIHTPGEEYILSGTYQCTYDWEGNARTLDCMAWALNTMWEALALCLALWVAVKHFRGLRRLSNLSTIDDLFPVLMKTHAAYFVSFAAVSCFQLVYDSSTINESAMGYVFAVIQSLWSLQLFVLGPRLILSIREYHAKLIADSNGETSISMIAFQEDVHVLSSISPGQLTVMHSTGDILSDDHLITTQTSSLACTRLE